ncbi:MAG: AI-2E family transporter [Acidobacteriota bacterium]
MSKPKRWFAEDAAEPHSPLWWLRWVPAFLLIGLILQLVYVVGRVALVPVLASFAMAYLLNPLVAALEKRGLSPSIATGSALAIATIALIAVLTFVIPGLLEQGATVGQKILLEFTPEKAVRQRAILRRYSPVLDRMIGERVEGVLRNPADAIGSPALWAVGGLSGFFATAVASLDLLLVPFFVFYLLNDFGRWRKDIEDLIPPRFRDPFSRLFDEVGRILETYVRAQLMIALWMVVFYAVGFAALGVPAWAGIALLAGLLNIVPYVGTILGLVLAVASTLGDGGGIWRIAGVVGVFAAVQTVEGYVLTPRIVGKRLRLHPMAVFLGLLIGGKLFGLLGIVLAVPTLAVSKVFLMFCRELYKGSYFYHAGDIADNEAPSEVLEERLSEAVDSVLNEPPVDLVNDEVALVDAPGIESPLRRIV